MPWSFHCLKDIAKDSIRIAHHVVVPVSQHSIAFACKSCGSISVIALLLQMLTPVEFDDQALLRANEVNDIAEDGDLAAEAMSCKFPTTQQLPESILGRSRSVA